MHDGSESDKARKIAEIQARGRQPLIEILVFGLDEKAAYKVEAAAIDLLGLKNLTNKQAGHESSLYGRIEVSELDARFDHGELAESDFLEDAVLVKVNQLYRNGMSDFELYEVTRGFWRVDKSKVEGIHLALAVYDGMVLEAYEIAAWLPAGSGMCAARSVCQAELAHRMEFVGRVANRCIRDRYVGKGVSGLYAPGSANPIRYVKAAYSRKALVEIHRVLEDVELTGEKREWCSSFSFYDPQQDDPYGLENSLNELLDLAYRGGFVPVDYEVVYQSIGKDDIAARKASKKELSNLSDHQLVSILGYQFRDDHFDNGSWIRTYVAKGLAYHYFHELAARWGCL
ncbi:hypothetical protein [Collinsella intestinalis]